MAASRPLSAWAGVPGSPGGCAMMGVMTEFWEQLLLSGIVLVFALILRAVLVRVINRGVKVLASRPKERNDDLGAKAASILAKASGLHDERQRQRVTTLGSLLRSVVDVVLIVLVVLTILATFGVPMAPLLASAGVGGVALGFGAQSLVKDYLSGIFMLAEDQFGVGDLIQVGELRGTVQEVTLRVTKLRDPSGTVWYVRNGEVLTLGNVSQGFSTAVVEVPVAIDEDPERVQQVLRTAVGTMGEEPEWSEVLLENPTVLGVESMSEGTMVLRILLKTGPDKQWGPMREARARAQRALAAEGVRGPILPGVRTTP